jgi:hypothetical protein
MLAATGLIGGGFGPFMVGALSDALAPQYGAESLRYAIAATILTPLVAAIFLVSAMRRAPDDYIAVGAA